MNNYEEGRLRRAGALDRGALAAIYDEYHQPIYRYIYRQVSDVETARDLTAEVFRHSLQPVRMENGPLQIKLSDLKELCAQAIVGGMKCLFKDDRPSEQTLHTSIKASNMF